MIVRERMREFPKRCTPKTSLVDVTELLWSCGFGALPVMESNGNVIGIVTDRDICVALGKSNRRPSELVAEQVMTRPVATCGMMDEIHDALRTMRSRRVRRLPVLNQAGKLEGMLCLSDLILDARHDDGSSPALSYEDVMGTLKGIYRHRSSIPVNCSSG